MNVVTDPAEGIIKPTKKVGVLLVHGIGEQRRYQHLESEVRKIVNAIIAEYGTPRRNVTVILETGTGDELFGAQMSWVSGRRAPLHAIVKTGGEIIDIAFHEVWWADINEPLTIGKQIRFWLWGVSLAGIPLSRGFHLPSAADNMRLPENSDRLVLRDRGRIFFVSAFIFMSGFTISLINVLLRRLRFSPIFATETIVNYLSGVKLYNQPKRAGGSPMDGPDEPPRAAIRRRMVRTMIDVATAGYERWYVLAHSLGTIVAWNGLMEPAEALPNYLDSDRWEAAKTAGMTAKSAEPIPEAKLGKMMPQRPYWLDDHAMIDRVNLFAKFRGLLTYGSPLERFCALWGNMVPINTDEDVFPEGAEWINVYDPTDPVASWLVNFNPKTKPRTARSVLCPANFPCRASGVVLLSHVRYFNAPADREQSKDYLSRQVARWLVGGESLTGLLNKAPTTRKSFWMPPANGGSPDAVEDARVRGRRRGRFIQWVAAALVLTALTVWFLDLLLSGDLQKFKDMATLIMGGSAVGAVGFYFVQAIADVLAGAGDMPA